MKFTHKIYLLALFITFSCENENICSIDKDNAGKEIFDLDEATCFIALKLGKNAPELELIRNSLIAEEKYMKKIGLISEKPNHEEENGSNAELDINKLVEFALDDRNIGLTKDELIEIYDTEFEYLKFIGVVKE